VAAKNTDADIQVETPNADASNVVPHQAAREKAKSDEMTVNYDNESEFEAMSFKNRVKSLITNKKVIASAVTAVALAVGVVVVQKRRGITEDEESSS
jgi:hypothetical protein